YLVVILKGSSDVSFGGNKDPDGFAEVVSMGGMDSIRVDATTLHNKKTTLLLLKVEKTPSSLYAQNAEGTDTNLIHKFKIIDINTAGQRMALDSMKKPPPIAPDQLLYQSRVQSSSKTIAEEKHLFPIALKLGICQPSPSS
ncbi:hypothetical protein H5410_045363, partial [Solanum commersonii]